MSDENSVPKSRREVWLRIALAVAEGMPEPEELSIGAGPGFEHILYLHLDDDAAAARWAEWCEAPLCEPHGMHRYSSHRAKWGYSWNVCVRQRTKVEQELAAQVVEAIGAGS